MCVLFCGVSEVGLEHSVCSIRTQATSEIIIRNIKDMPPSMGVIRAMDDISDTVCSVVDAAELCRNTHPDK